MLFPEPLCHGVHFSFSSGKQEALDSLLLIDLMSKIKFLYNILVIDNRVSPLFSLLPFLARGWCMNSLSECLAASCLRTRQILTCRCLLEETVFSLPLYYHESILPSFCNICAGVETGNNTYTFGLQLKPRNILAFSSYNSEDS